MFEFKSGWLAMLIVVLLGLFAGNLTGDQATLRDCATTGRAEMLGGGSISCSVIRAPAP